MAGYDTTRLGKGARRLAQTVVALTGLIFCAPWSSAPQAAYSVITRSGQMSAGCYELQGYRLILCSGEEIALQDVIAVDSAGLTQEERCRRQEAWEECLQRIDALGREDGRILSLEKRLHEVLEYIVGLETSRKRSSRADDALDDAFLMLDEVENAAQTQKQAWERLKMPELLFLPLREIKVLQFTSRIRSCREWRVYLRRRDITLREYAREHHRQTQSFETRFQSRLAAVRAKISGAADNGASEPDGTFWQESEAPQPLIIPKIPK